MSAQLTAPAAIVLAAGQGTRMRSRIPKVLHPLAGRSLIDHVLDALAHAGIGRPVVVTGHGADAVEAAIATRAATARQVPQRGTADAVRVGLEAVSEDAGTIIVTYGDVPLQPSSLFVALLSEREASDAAIALVSVRVADSAGYGRVIRGSDGGATAIVEERDTDDTTRAINEINVGT
ncbi:MAG: NTP transferase domain-containing protein, partial [Candidatus Limnocylindria bacterium]